MMRCGAHFVFGGEIAVMFAASYHYTHVPSRISSTITRSSVAGLQQRPTTTSISGLRMISPKINRIFRGLIIDSNFVGKSRDFGNISSFQGMRTVPHIFFRWRSETEEDERRKGEKTQRVFIDSDAQEEKGNVPIIRLYLVKNFLHTGQSFN